MFKERNIKSPSLILELWKKGPYYNQEVGFFQVSPQTPIAPMQRFHQPHQMNHPLGMNSANIFTDTRFILGRAYPSVFNLNKQRHEELTFLVKCCWMPWINTNQIFALAWNPPLGPKFSAVRAASAPDRSLSKGFIHCRSAAASLRYLDTTVVCNSIWLIWPSLGWKWFMVLSWQWELRGEFPSGTSMGSLVVL